MTFTALKRGVSILRMLNPNSLHLVKAHVIVASMTEGRRFRVRMPGHALRHRDTPAVFQVIGFLSSAEGVAAYCRLLSACPRPVLFRRHDSTGLVDVLC